MQFFLITQSYSLIELISFVIESKCNAGLFMIFMIDKLGLFAHLLPVVNYFSIACIKLLTKLVNT